MARERGRVSQLEAQLDMNARLSDADMRGITREVDRLELEVSGGGRREEEEGGGRELVELLRAQRLETAAGLLSLRQQMEATEEAQKVKRPLDVRLPWFCGFRPEYRSTVRLLTPLYSLDYRGTIVSYMVA